MEASVLTIVTTLFAANLLQTCWIVGYKKYFSPQQTFLLTGYMFFLLLINYFISTNFSFSLLIPFILIESGFILYFTKSWALTLLYSILQNMVMLISWLFTWDIIYISRLKDIISPEQFLYFKPIAIISQQLLQVALLLIVKKISSKYSIFNSIAQLQKKYIATSVFGFVLLYSLNILRQGSIVQFGLLPFFQLTLILLALSIVFCYLIYIISRFYQQQTQISLLSKKTARELQNIDLANEFRHDYRNILLSLNTYLDQKQFEQASTYLSSIINYSKSFTETNYYAQISTINIPAVQGLLLHFFEKCANLKIPVQFFTDQNISDFDLTINLVDFIRCLSILLDNAVEASVAAEKPLIQLTMIHKNQDLFIEVKNKSEAPIVIEKIFKNNFTTKKGNQGKGIPIFVKLLKQYRKVTYSFSRENNFFVASFTLPTNRLKK